MDIRVIAGSKSDKDNVNVLLEVLRDVGVSYRVSFASCHRHIGGKHKDFEELVAEIRESIIIMIGGLSLAAPGIIESLQRNMRNFDHLVIGVPTDKAALSAIQDLPKGTAILTCGFNEKSPKSGIINSALVAAKLAGMLGGNLAIDSGLRLWYSKAAEENPLVEEVELENGLIP